MLLKILYNNYKLSKKNDKSTNAKNVQATSQKRGKSNSRTSRGGSKGAASQRGRKDAAKGDDLERIEGILDLTILNNGVYAKANRSESPDSKYASAPAPASKQP